MKFAVAAIVKNELATLLEWIAYHRAVGVEHFIIVNNDSTDGTRELLRKLARRGIVKTFGFKTLAGRAPQNDAYQKVLKYARRRFDVLAFIDADEYLLPTDGETSVLPAISELFSNQEVSAVSVNWACFGSAGEVYRDERLVPERFLWRARDEFPANFLYKSLVRPKRVIRFLNPHQAWLASGRYVSTDGELLVGDQWQTHGFSETLQWQRLRINHYVVKSMEEFLVRKSRIGSAAKAGKVKHRDFFKRHDKNEVKDQLILTHMEATRRELEQLSQSLATPRLFEQFQSAKQGAYKAWDLAAFWLRKSLLYSGARLRHGRLGTADYERIHKSPED